MSSYDVPVEVIRTIYELIQYIPPVVYVSCNHEMNLESIKKRNRHVCYIDELTGQDLLDCIKDYRSSCEKIKSLLEPLTICRENDIALNVELIRNVIGI